MKIKKKTLRLMASCLFAIFAFQANATHQPEYSTAGFYELDGTGRTAYSMNPAWRFYKGDVEGAEKISFDDSKWNMVSLPDGIEYLPTEASGCINYQGEVWYRKHFAPEESWKGKKLFLHFEAIMGKSKVWVNGELVTEHFGGFLPVIADVSSHLKYGEDNVIAVWADNSDDPSYPPGKAQDVLDFTYCGGIYRDCWMIVHNNIFITDPNYEDVTAGGGLFVSYGKVSENEAELNMDVHVRNTSGKNFEGKVIYELYDRNGKIVNTTEKGFSVSNGKTKSMKSSMDVVKPHLWTPDTPYLYNLHVYLKHKNGNIVDGYRRRIGIRSIEFKGKDGFWLNGKPYPEPLIGANRHQDFAVIGNALSNSLHWRDAKKLRDAGLRVIRNAHYPQDPAFMDACDELGLFVIVNTPGWQFWNDEPVFAQRVYSDIRNMVRRDRNHPSVWMWEPILNETWYPDEFAKRVSEIVVKEYPYPYCYCGCDVTVRGQQSIPIVGGITPAQIPSIGKGNLFDLYVAEVEMKDILNVVGEGLKIFLKRGNSAIGSGRKPTVHAVSLATRSQVYLIILDDVRKTYDEKSITHVFSSKFNIYVTINPEKFPSNIISWAKAASKTLSQNSFKMRGGEAIICGRLGNDWRGMKIVKEAK